jgi:hypothetical protein
VDWQVLPGSSVEKWCQDLGESVVTDHCGGERWSLVVDVYLLNLNNTVFSTKIIFFIKLP